MHPYNVWLLSDTIFIYNIMYIYNVLLFHLVHFYITAYIRVCMEEEDEIYRLIWPITNANETHYITEQCTKGIADDVQCYLIRRLSYVRIYIS